MAATSRRLGSGGCAVGASAGTGPRLLRGWDWGEGEGVGVGPLILAPFLSEHFFWGILGSNSDVTARRRVFVSSVVGGWVGIFLRLRARVLVRERLEIVRCFAAPGQ